MREEKPVEGGQLAWMSTGAKVMGSGIVKMENRELDASGWLSLTVAVSSISPFWNRGKYENIDPLSVLEKPCGVGVLV